MNPIDVVRTATCTGAAPNISDALTVNGQPGDLRCSSKDMTTFTVKSDETNLLRFIKAALNTELFVSIAGHTMTVVATTFTTSLRGLGKAELPSRVDDESLNWRGKRPANCLGKGVDGRAPGGAALVFVLLVGGLASGAAGAEIRRQKNVQVALRAKWAGTPLLLEARVSGHGTGENFDEASGSSSSGGTCCWVDTGKVPLFNSADLREWLEGLGNLAIDSTEQPELFDFDHVYPRANITAPVAIFYGAVGTKCFKELHAQLAEASKQGKVRYALRPVLPSGCQATSSFCGSIGAVDAVTLSGYGVELALKNMEYKAMDDTAIKKGVPLEDPKTEDLSQEVRGFIFSKILERKPELNTEIMAFRDYLLSSTVSDTLEVWELKDLGHQTAQRIVQASDPLQSMQEINQNFPSIVSSLSRMKLEDSIKDEIIANQRMVPPGKSLMALNGALINIEDLDLYLLMDMVHGELSLADQFVRLKLPQSAARKILSAPPPAESNSFRVDFRSSHVHYLNNLEEDAMYRRWRSNLQETIDMILSLYQDNVPIRFGIIMYSSRLINVIEESDGTPPVYDGEDTSILIHKSRNGEDDYNEDLVEALHVEGAFVDSLLSSAKSHPQDVLLKLQKENMYKEEAEESSRFVYKLGLYKLQCCLLMNGLVHESNEITGKSAGKKFVSLFASYHQQDYVFNDIKYLQAPGSVDDAKPVTHLIAVDLSSKVGTKLLHEAIRYLIDGSSRARVGLLLYVRGGSSEPILLLKDIIDRTILSFSLAAETALPVDDYKAWFTSFSADTVLKGMDKLSGFLFGQLGLVFGSNAVITNGRVSFMVHVYTRLVFVMNEGEPFLANDLGLLESIEYDLRTKYIFEIIEEVEFIGVDPDDLTSQFYSDTAMLVSSSMSVREWPSERAHFEILHAEHSAIKLNNENSSIHIDAVIDPLSPTGQKLAPLLRILWKQIQPSMRIVLNPISSLADLPLKNFYRFVLPSMDDFSSTDYSVHGPKAFFANMPLSKTLTMNIDVPEPWLVEPVVAMSLHGKRPRSSSRLAVYPWYKTKTALGRHTCHGQLGLLADESLPGVWYLQLAPGRSADLYELPPKLVAIDSLRGKLMHIEVQKKKGKEREELLNAADDHHFQEKTDNKGWNNNLLKWASSLISGDASSKNQADKVTDRKDARQGETINIFSVASGHLYERFLKIMILSVLKKTQRPVKFWFIKNYLSPQFKVIFVDADQIVRADMGELYDMNLKGRPLAYTPFCDNNKDMDGYRFWKQVSHLQKIIALYVVDLAKFRQTASGDTLRVFYEQLSKDPNSLSNLDQNKAQLLLMFHDTRLLLYACDMAILTLNTLTFRISRIMLNIPSLYSLFLKNGCGVNLGVEMPQRQEQRPLIYATIQ
ncbi:hypothetical protein HU200_049461 [Digitaria exilis]|uniref:UDP-glucose:glycoprotein glucosyltransferase n=1 Tax=Digitaria exilis TaxID=1010633 RepID=A0A835B440_9POAL|nr:hypothetical protein HU200_049461 [Digitaria exilis]